jgi:hypothetical protein
VGAREQTVQSVEHQIADASSGGAVTRYDVVAEGDVDDEAVAPRDDGRPGEWFGEADLSVVHPQRVERHAGGRGAARSWLGPKGAAVSWTARCAMVCKCQIPLGSSPLMAPPSIPVHEQRFTDI